jgi:excinuclease ABC subunit C
MVVFENGKSKNSDYRKFKIKTIYGPNDYASMEEVITRRLNRYKTEGDQAGAKFGHLPDIIFVDGGKPQISAAEKVVEDMELSIPVCGMVKDDRHRTRGLLYHGQEVLLPVNSEGFRLVTRIQDEVHRFAIEYHRKLRADAQTHSVLDDIPTIGPTRRKALMKRFGSIEKIRRASQEELAETETMNAKAAAAVYEFFRK